jgi:hypothetical protein
MGLILREKWGVGRGERIRTSGLYVPNVALYLTKLHAPVRLLSGLMVSGCVPLSR